jgi:hypothetical protein
LEDGSTLLADSYSSPELPATLIIPEPRLTARQDLRSPAPSPAYTAPTPAWPPVARQQAFPGSPSTPVGKGISLSSLLCAIGAFLLLVFCIFGGAAGVNESLRGGVFIFSAFLALAGAVLGIMAVAKTGKDTSTQNARMMAIVALLLNSLYLLIAVAFLILVVVTDE